MALIPVFSRFWGSVCVNDAFLERLSSAAFSRFEAEFDRVPSVDLKLTDALTLARLLCYLERVPFDETAAREAISSPLSLGSQFPARKQR